jgi:hypothetical protein
MTEVTRTTGYTRLRQICLVAPHLEPLIGDIAEIMGLSVCYRDGNLGKYGLENALLPVDTILLEVVAPLQPGTAAGRFLDKTGGRGAAVREAARPQLPCFATFWSASAVLQTRLA